jgi:hypothetical protein
MGAQRGVGQDGEEAAPMADDRITRPRVSLLAFISLVCGIVWALGIGSMLAVIFGHLALYRLRRTGRPGRRIAIVGLLLGYAGIVVTFVVLLGGDVSVQDAPQSWRRL